MQCIKVIWGSGFLTIVNPTPDIESYLSYHHKHFEQGRAWSEKVFLFTVLSEQNPRIIQTMQGYVDKVLDLAHKTGQPIQYEDRRDFFPKPRLEAMGGFRYGQEALLRHMLSYERSGLLRAPTRYGKTILMVNLMRAHPDVPTVLAAPGVNLLGQLVNDLKNGLPGRNIKGLFTGSKDRAASDDITVVSLDSLHKVPTETTKLLIIDEPHESVSPKRAPKLAQFRHARIFGFGATLEGRYDKSDKLITGLFGPILATRSFQEAVAEGAICMIKVQMLRMRFQPFNCYNRNQAYNKMIFRNQGYNRLVKKIAEGVIPAAFQTLIFADEVKQIDLMNQFIDDSRVAIAGRMDEKARAVLFQEMVEDKVKRCISTDIFATGVTFPQLRVIINAASGGSGITATQKPGRLAQCQPGKKCGHLIDFLWEPEGIEDIEELDASKDPWTWVVRDSLNRKQRYEDLGYQVTVIDELPQLVID